MDLTRAARLLAATGNLLRVRLTGARRPVAVRIQVTSRCHMRCLYCGINDKPAQEMTADQVKRILDQAAALGCLRISFSGGEPMLRPDIGELVDHCASLGMAPEINSSGLDIAGRIGELGRLELLKLSLDGPEDVHDAQCRRPGSYQEVLQALTAARANGIRTVLVATITRLNVDALDHVLEVARRHDALAAFQPLKAFYKGSGGEASLMPDPEAMRRAVASLRALNRAGDGVYMRNSALALSHISRWPNYRPLRCWAGRIFCIVGPDGTLQPCDRTALAGPLPNCLDLGLRGALARLPEPDCEGCGFCGALELNLAMRPDPRILPHVLRLIRR